MKKRADYTAPVTNEFVNSLTEAMTRQDILDSIEVFEGTLNDNYIFSNTETISIGRVKPRRFIIIECKYENEYSSSLVMTMTDNEQKVDDFRERLLEAEEFYK